MRTLAILALLLGLTLSDTPSAVARTGSPGASRAFWPALGFKQVTPHPAVVRVMAADSSGMSQGSGTFVGANGQYGVVITNWHVVRDAVGQITVVFPDGFQSAARLLKSDADWDLAALWIWRPSVDPLPIASVAPRPGDVLSIAGYGQGPYRTVTGRCTQYVAPALDMPYEMVELTAQARQGDSGGPILNERGELAGVLFGSSGRTTTGSHCGRVRWFLNSVWTDPQGAEHGPMLSSAPRSDPPSPVSAWGSPRGHSSAESWEAATAQVATDAVATQELSEISPPIAWAPAGTDLSPPSELTDWLRMAGETPFEQAKTTLAAIGLLAVLIHLSRWTVRSEGRRKSGKASD